MRTQVLRYFAALLLLCGALSAEMIVRTKDGRKYTVPVTGAEVQSIEFVDSVTPTSTFDGTWTDTSSTCGGSTYTIREAPANSILSIAIKVTCNGGKITGIGTGSGFTWKNATTLTWSYRYSSHSTELIETGVSELVFAADGKSARLTSRDSVGHSGTSTLVRH